MWRFAVLGSAIGLVALAAPGVHAQSSVTARADMTDLKGKAVGHLTFRQMPQGVLVRIEGSGLPPGWHAIHIHETAACEPPFASAGGHMNPGGAQHGFSEGGTHAGDLPNIHAGSDGVAKADILNTRIALAPDRPTDVSVLNRALSAVESAAGTQAYNLFDDNGSAVIIHAKDDDYVTDPAGNSGDRIACGIVRRG